MLIKPLKWCHNDQINETDPVIRPAEFYGEFVPHVPIIPNRIAWIPITITSYSTDTLPGRCI